MLTEREFTLAKSRIPFWNFIHNELADQIRSHAYSLDYSAGDKLTDAGRSHVGMIIVLSGRIRVSLVSTTARELTIAVQKRDGIIYIGGNPTPQVMNNFELEAETHSKVIILPMSDFDTMIRSDPHIENVVLKSVLGLFNGILFDMQNFLFQNLEQRLASHLLFEHTQQGSLQISTTHQRIANSIASSREVVSRALKNWEHNGIVLLSRGRIELLKPDIIKSMAAEG